MRLGSPWSACAPKPSGLGATLRTPCHPWDTHVSEGHQPEGLQVLPRPHPADLLAGCQRDRRAERLGQVEHHGRRALGARRAEPLRRPWPSDARRDLRRGQRPVTPPLCRGRGRDRQLGGPRRERVLRDRHLPPDRAQRRRRVSAERSPLPADGRGRGAVRHEHGPRGPLGYQPGQGRGDRQLEAPRPAAADRGGGRARQAPQAPPQRPAQARPYAGQPRACDGRGAGGPLAPAAAEAPGRGGGAHREAAAPDKRIAGNADRRRPPRSARTARRRRGEARAGACDPRLSREALRGGSRPADRDRRADRGRGGGTPAPGRDPGRGPRGDRARPRTGRVTRPRGARSARRPRGTAAAPRRTRRGTGRGGRGSSDGRARGRARQARRGRLGGGRAPEQGGR